MLLNAAAQDQQRFAGTWEAKYKGAVICGIKLEAGEKLSGATYGCNIHVNDDGDLIETQPSDSTGEPSPIKNARIDGDKLVFEIMDDDDPMKCELTLTGEGRANLRILNAPIKIKPIHFEKR